MPIAKRRSSLEIFTHDVSPVRTCKSLSLIRGVDLAGQRLCHVRRQSEPKPVSPNVEWRVSPVVRHAVYLTSWELNLQALLLRVSCDPDSWVRTFRWHAA
jgi:hypothetical protein